MTEKDVIKECIAIVGCEKGRISKPLGRMFFIAGDKRSTKDDPGQIFRNGKPYDFVYIDERVVASGDTYDELIANVKEYKRLCGISWEQYFNELIEQK